LVRVGNKTACEACAAKKVSCSLSAKARGGKSEASRSERAASGEPEVRPARKKQKRSPAEVIDLSGPDTEAVTGGPKELGGFLAKLVAASERQAKAAERSARAAERMAIATEVGMDSLRSASELLDSLAKSAKGIRELLWVQDPESVATVLKRRREQQEARRAREEAASEQEDEDGSGSEEESQ
jgi:hypothetical protein